MFYLHPDICSHTPSAKWGAETVITYSLQTVQDIDWCHLCSDLCTTKQNLPQPSFLTSGTQKYSCWALIKDTKWTDYIWKILCTYKRNMECVMLRKSVIQWVRVSYKKWINANFTAVRVSRRERERERCSMFTSVVCNAEVTASLL